MEKIDIEFDYMILKKGEPSDFCYATVSLTEIQLEEIVNYLIEQNSEGLLTDIPEKYLNMLVDAALDDAAIIYPNFNDEKAGFSVMLSRFLPDDILDYLPEELIENFLPEMFVEAEDPSDNPQG